MFFSCSDTEWSNFSPSLYTTPPFQANTETFFSSPGVCNDSWFSHVHWQTDTLQIKIRQNIVIKQLTYLFNATSSSWWEIWVLRLRIWSSSTRASPTIPVCIKRSNLRPISSVLHFLCQICQTWSTPSVIQDNWETEEKGIFAAYTLLKFWTGHKVGYARFVKCTKISPINVLKTMHECLCLLKKRARENSLPFTDVFVRKFSLRFSLLQLIIGIKNAVLKFGWLLHAHVYNTFLNYTKHEFLCKGMHIHEKTELSLSMESQLN